jgi:hypothetical protein
MNYDDAMPVVLARVPDLSGSGRSRRRREEPKSNGRMLNQAISFKLLGIAASLLLVVAIVPFAFNGNPQADEAPATPAAPMPVWQPQASLVSTETGVAAPAPALPEPALTPLAAPAAAIPPPSPTFPIPPPAVQAYPVASVPPAISETPTMSQWPNPAPASNQVQPGDPVQPGNSAQVSPLPTVDGQVLPAGANPTTAIRPFEYNRNRYDGTRSGVH